MIHRLFRLSPSRLAILSGVLIGISYPPLKLGFLAWIGLIPLLEGLKCSNPFQSAKYSFIAGVMANLIIVYWLTFNSGAYFFAVFLSMIGSVVYLSMFWGVIGYLFSLFHIKFGKGYFLFPFIWISIEYLQSFGTLGFPWISLATTQGYYLPLIQMVEVSGIYGLSFLIVTTNVLIYRYLRIPYCNKPQVRKWIVLLVVLPWLLGYFRMAQLNRSLLNHKNLKVAVIQPNVGPHEKWALENRDWVFEHLDSLYIEATKSYPQLIIWPESATPTYLRKNWHRMKQVKQRVEESGIPLITGIIDWEYEKKQRKIYNSVLMITPSKKETIYHKMHLVPFGEYIPLSNHFSVLDQLNLGQGNFDSGQSYTIFNIDSVSFSSVICFESAFPRLIREFVKRGAKFIVIVVNDGWFGRTSEPYQHEILARFRAIEFRMPVIRCANTGISVVYDALGRVQGYLPLLEEGIIISSIFPGTMVTFYARFGDLFPQLSIFITIILGLWFLYREKSSS